MRIAQTGQSENVVSNFIELDVNGTWPLTYRYTNTSALVEGDVYFGRVFVISAANISGVGTSNIIVVRMPLMPGLRKTLGFHHYARPHAHPLHHPLTNHKQTRSMARTPPKRRRPSTLGCWPR